MGDLWLVRQGSTLKPGGPPQPIQLRKTDTTAHRVLRTSGTKHILRMNTISSSGKQTPRLRRGNFITFSHEITSFHRQDSTSCQSGQLHLVGNCPDTPFLPPTRRQQAHLRHRWERTAARLQEPPAPSEDQEGGLPPHYRRHP